MTDQEALFSYRLREAVETLSESRRMQPTAIPSVGMAEAFLSAVRELIGPAA